MAEAREGNLARVTLVGAPVLEEIDRLPSLPRAVIEVLRLTADPRSRAREVADAIGQDPALTARVLRLVNSAWFGFSAPIATAHHAVVILGFETVRALAVGVAALRTARASGAAAAPLDEYWRHSAAVASCARDIARTALPAASWGEAFTAGLLHDVGHLVLASVAPKALRWVLECGRRHARPLPRLEREILGLDHAELGAYAAERWGLPEVLVSAIRHHHDPRKAEEYRDIVAAVHLANIVAHSAGVSGVDANAETAVDEAAWVALSSVHTPLGPHDLARFAGALAQQAPAVSGLATALARSA